MSVNVEQPPHVVGTRGVVKLGRKETWRELQKNTGTEFLAVPAVAAAAAAAAVM